MVDRRFLDINFTVLSITNAPSVTPVKGEQYIVGLEPTGAFANATPNAIAVFDGEKWLFNTPRLNALEVLNVETNEILKFNGSEWETIITINAGIPPVLDIVATGSTLPSTAVKGEKFLNKNDKKLYTAISENIWDAGTALSNGERYASATDYKIYEKSGTILLTQKILSGNFFLNEADNYLYVYNNFAFVRASADHETVELLKKSAEKNKTEIDALKLAQAVLASRIDAQVTATTTPDADYAAEVVDGRVDAWGNENSSSGENIRYGQKRLSENQILLQEQIDQIASAILEVTIMLADIFERIRQNA